MKFEDLRTELDKCVSCGRCLGVCPVYQLTGWEGSVARGKLALLKAELDGPEDLHRRMKDLLSHCLLCGACSENCASGVKADEIIQTGRAQALQGGGLNRIKSLLTRDILARGLGVKAAMKTRSLFLKNVPPESGLHFRFPVPGLGKDRWLPGLAPKTFLEDIPDLSTNQGKGPRIALFVGCVANFMRPQSARAAIDLLHAAGASVVIPPQQVCCGKPALGAGDLETAKYVARKNLSIFNPDDFDYMVTYCATCSSQLKEYASFLDDEEDKILAGNLAGKVRDFTDLLSNELNFQPEISADSDFEPLKVMYHDPCHLKRKQGIFKEPRKLIQELPGVELVGADEPAVCCGYGGIFNLWHYDKSQKLYQKREETIKPYEPDILTTNCSGCWLQFEDQTRRFNAPFRVVPLVELIRERGMKK
jgi:glycolate oxidase iron-sulfur subunit